jgi:hypothetical protein
MKNTYRSARNEIIDFTKDDVFSFFDKPVHIIDCPICGRKGRPANQCTSFDHKMRMADNKNSRFAYYEVFDSCCFRNINKKVQDELDEINRKRVLGLPFDLSEYSIETNIVLNLRIKEHCFEIQNEINSILNGNFDLIKALSINNIIFKYINENIELNDELLDSHEKLKEIIKNSIEISLRELKK